MFESAEGVEEKQRTVRWNHGGKGDGSAACLCDCVCAEDCLVSVRLPVCATVCVMRTVWCLSGVCAFLRLSECLFFYL